MSMTPVCASLSMRKKISPLGVTTLYRPFATGSSFRQKSVAHFGRFSIRDRNSNVRSFDAMRVSVRVLAFIVMLHGDRMQRLARARALREFRQRRQPPRRAVRRLPWPGNVGRHTPFLRIHVGTALSFKGTAALRVPNRTLKTQ